MQAIANSPMTVTELQKFLDLSSTDIIDGLQSIDRRGLLQKNTTDAEVSFDVSIVLKDFLGN
jgi:predicted transcriptional regulator